MLPSPSGRKPSYEAKAMRVDLGNGHGRRPRRRDPDDDEEFIVSARVRPTVAPVQWLTRPEVGRELDDPRYRRRLAAQAAALPAPEIGAPDGD